MHCKLLPLGNTWKSVQMRIALSPRSRVLTLGGRKVKAGCRRLSQIWPDSSKGKHSPMMIAQKEKDEISKVVNICDQFKNARKILSTVNLFLPKNAIFSTLLGGAKSGEWTF